MLAECGDSGPRFRDDYFAIAERRLTRPAVRWLFLFQRLLNSVLPVAFDLEHVRLGARSQLWLSALRFPQCGLSTQFRHVLIMLW